MFAVSFHIFKKIHCFIIPILIYLQYHRYITPDADSIKLTCFKHGLPADEYSVSCHSRLEFIT